MEIVYALQKPLLVGEFADVAQISLSALSRLWSATGAKMAKPYKVLFAYEVFFAVVSTGRCLTKHIACITQHLFLHTKHTEPCNRYNLDVSLLPE